MIIGHPDINEEQHEAEEHYSEEEINNRSSFNN
jgi:hypothetical protein